MSIAKMNVEFGKMRNKLLKDVKNLFSDLIIEVKSALENSVMEKVDAVTSQLLEIPGIIEVMQENLDIFNENILSKIKTTDD